MNEEIIHIETSDCLPFPSNAHSSIIEKFMAANRDNIFWFGNNSQDDDDNPLAEYDFKRNAWRAGRFVGEALFLHEGKNYKITIKPRFGEHILFRMLEEIFNIKITFATSDHSNSNDWQHFIKKIIAFIWIQKLANANLHGLPRKTLIKENKGAFVRGKLAVRQSIMPYYLREQVVSHSREKAIDDTISQILYQAYQIISKDFMQDGINIPDSAQDALHQVLSNTKEKRLIDAHEVRNLQYKEIYLSWKPIVEFSWDIIRRKQLSMRQNFHRQGMGFFLDMAEIWEQYLRSLLRRHLFSQGWTIRNVRETAYPGKVFQRDLIPDLVFEKSDACVIWDAKYKRMAGRQIDIDRADFFQIHTYIQHYLNHRNVVAGGLLYPLSKEPDAARSSSEYLLNDQGFQVKFHIDGIVFYETSAGEKNKDADEKELEFIKRALEIIETTVTGEFDNEMAI